MQGRKLILILGSIVCFLLIVTVGIAIYFLYKAEKEYNLLKMRPAHTARMDKFKNKGDGQTNSDEQANSDQRNSHEGQSATVDSDVNDTRTAEAESFS